MMFSDLPRDLESEILSRVPATCLKELLTTCKRWYALFKDPRFVKNNSSKAATQVILRDYGGYSVADITSLIHGITFHEFRNGFDPSIGIADQLNRLNISDIFHCEGLLLCTTTGQTIRDTRLVVWNPCTGQTRWIQSSKGLFYKYVLGYGNNNNNSCDSCKILTYDSFVNCVRAFTTFFEIYDFNSGSWRILDDVSPNLQIDSDGVTLNGNAYWFGSDKQDRLVKFILKFDFTTEMFGRLRLPPLSFNTGDHVDHVVLSVVRKEKLGLLQWRFDGNALKMNIWVTNTKVDEAKDLSWSNFLQVDFGNVMLSSEMSHRTSFLVDEEKKIVVCCETENYTDPYRTKYYLAKDGVQIYQDITEESKSNNNWLFLVSYVPSLVQIQ